MVYKLYPSNRHCPAIFKQIASCTPSLYIHAILGVVVFNDGAASLWVAVDAGMVTANSLPIRKCIVNAQGDPFRGHGPANKLTLLAQVVERELPSLTRRAG
jgi:hypothetical protein